MNVVTFRFMLKAKRIGELVKMSETAKAKLDKLITEIENEDAPDHIQYCYVILDELKEIRKLMGK